MGPYFSAVNAQTTDPDQQGAKLGIWNAEVEAQWWRENQEPEQWFALVDRMNVTLRDAHQRHSLRKMIRNPHWLGWMLHTRWLSLFPRDWKEREIFQDKQGREIFVRLGRTPEVRDLFLASLVPGDDDNEAIAILTKIAKDHPDKIKEYRNLAVAYAIVYDQPIPDSWPHPFVDHTNLPVGDSDPSARFAFYVACQEAKLLVHDLKRVGTQDLTFLVDAPIEFNEFRYAQKISISTPKKLADLYPQVPYDQQRIITKQYKWEDQEYRLHTIGKQGGICMDQAYFVAMTGKAKGIPTLLFTGQGISGDHGWVGYLGHGSRWEFEVAKYGGQDYPIGQAFDPQTWQRITDSELAALQSGTDFDGDFTEGHRLLQWAALCEGHAFYAEIVRAARISMSKDPRPWQLEADLLEVTDSSPEDRMRFWTDWVGNYSRNADLKVKGEMRRIAILEEMGKEKEADQLRRRLTSSNRSKRFDLGIAIAADPVFRKLRLKNYEGAEKAFDSAMRKFGSKAGGHLFYNLLQPYTLTCIQENQTKMAKDAMDHIDDFQASPGTILDQEMQALIKRVQSL